MKSFLKYLLLVIIGTTVVDICYRMWCDSAFQNPKPNSNIAIAYPYESHSEPCDIAILGGSKANCHYNTKMIEDSLLLKVFNYGASGESIIHQYLCLVKAINNGELKIAILDLSILQLSEEWVRRRMPSFYAYYWSNEYIHDLVRDIEGSKMDILLLSALYQYNSVAHRIIFSYFKKYKDRGGFLPVPYTGVAFKPTPNSGVLDEYVISPYAVKYLGKMSQLCQENDVKFIVCISPDLITKNNGLREIEEFCYEFKIDLWNYSDTIHDFKLFKENIHMNERGANEFTKMLINQIKHEVL